MEKARYKHVGGPLVTVEEFLRCAGAEYEERGIFPFCRVCKERVFIHAPYSVKVRPSFNHGHRDPNSDPLDDCRLANRRDSRFAGMEPSTWDEESADALRKQFFASENLREAYGFMVSLCANKRSFTRAITFSIFEICIKRANKKDIWSYKGIQLWIIPYILLALTDFSGQSKRGEYKFRFIIKKPPRTNADALWLTPSQCKLEKIFVDSGKPFGDENNPFPFSFEFYKKRSEDNSWIANDFIERLRRLQAL